MMNTHLNNIFHLSIKSKRKGGEYNGRKREGTNNMIGTAMRGSERA